MGEEGGWMDEMLQRLEGCDEVERHGDGRAGDEPGSRGEWKKQLSTCKYLSCSNDVLDVF